MAEQKRQLQKELKQMPVPDEQEYEGWINKKWRPMVAWVYIVTCAFDFVVAPLVFMGLQFEQKATPIVQWVPLTLQGSGMYHIAMAAIIGVAAWSRGQEKLAILKQNQ